VSLVADASYDAKAAVTQCRIMTDVDEECGNESAMIGDSWGNYGFANTSGTFVAEASSRCRRAAPMPMPMPITRGECEPGGLAAAVLSAWRLLMSRVGRAARAAGALGVAGWLLVEALSGSRYYTIQGDLCDGLRLRIESQRPLPAYPTLATCAQRQNVVYRAFLLELGVALGSAAVGARWLRAALRAGSNRK
jgi:hypothetical protein